MTEMSSGTALRQLQQAQAGMKKARQALRFAKGDPEALRKVLVVGWTSLAHAHRLVAEIPLEAANEPVMTKQLAVQRYATALLVRLRRIVRNDFSDEAEPDEVEDIE
jgi:hypothetical protein